MAGEIQFRFLQGASCYFLVRNAVAQVWNNGTSAFEAYNASNYANYVNATIEQGVTGYFQGNMPSAVPPGVYSVDVRQQMGVSADPTDPSPAGGDVQWNGAFVLPLSDLATSGQVARSLPIPIYRGQMVRNFPFKLVSSLDHVTPLTSGIVSGQISRDGGAFTALQSGAFSEVGLGFYTLQALTSGDLLGNTVALTLNGVGVSGGVSDPRDFTLVLQRSSGQ